MGFMGFGMQKWIYTMRPRKPFSMQRKGSFTVILTYKRSFKLQPSKNKNGYNFGVLFFLILAVIISLAIPKWLEQARIHNKEVTKLRIESDNIAFKFLMKSGKLRLKSGRISGAYSEFKLAHAIQPNNIEVNKLLFETLEILCLDYCKDLSNN